MSDQDLYEQTLALYDDPIFAKQYAQNIEDRLDFWMFDEFLPLVKPGGDILDIASAGGRDSAYLAGKGFKVTGIDQAKELIEIAKQNHPGIKFLVGDFVKLSFDDSSFDGIWCKAALVHLPTQASVETAIKGFHRVLKPGGVIMINTKAKQTGQTDTTVRTDKLSGKQRFFRFQDEHEFKELLKAAGFKVLNSRVYNEQSAVQYQNLRDEDWLWILAQKPEAA